MSACTHHGSVTRDLRCSRCGLVLAKVDALRGLPPPRRRRVLERLDAALGPEATASLETALDFHRRPVQRFPGPTERQGIVVYAGDFGAGKTWTALQLLQHLILTRRARAPRIVAATGADARSLVAHPLTGLLQWQQPGARYVWEPSKGWEGELVVNGTLLTLCSVEAPRSVLGVGSDVQLLDDPPKWGPTGKPLLVNALRSAREKGALTIIPTTPDGLLLVAEVLGVQVENLADAGVLVINLGRTEDNAGNLDPTYFKNKANLMRAGLWNPVGSTSPWATVGFPTLRLDACPELVELAVSIDPSKTSSAKSCEVGIVGGGRDARDVLHVRHDVSGVLGGGAEGWPKIAWDLFDRMRKEHPGAPICFVFESNVGRAYADLLYAEERARRRARGEPGVNADCRVVFVRADADKCVRAEAPARVAAQGQVRFASDLHELEGQLRNLTPKGADSDRADAANHLLTHLGQLAEGQKAMDEKQTEQEAAEQCLAAAEMNAALFAKGRAAPPAPGQPQPVPGAPPGDARSPARAVPARTASWRHRTTI